MSKALIPKVIWMFWMQGLKELPELIRICHASWKKQNPDWQVVFLDRDNLNDYLDMQSIVDMNREDITIQKISNLIRINLMAEYGGIWVDATTFCCRPLDRWIHDAASSGFFVFSYPQKDRILSSWFMASAKGNVLSTTFAAAHNRFWQNNHFVNQDKRLGRFFLRHLTHWLNTDDVRTRWWLSFWVRKVLKIYPYYIFHYHFAEIVRTDVLCRKNWDEMKKISSDIPHRLIHAGLSAPLTKEIKKEIDSKEAPLYKLSWKYDKNAFVQGCHLDYLLKTLEND